MDGWNEPSRVTLFVFGMLVSVAGFLWLPVGGYCPAVLVHTPAPAITAYIHTPAPPPAPAPPPPPIIISVQPPAPAPTPPQAPPPSVAAVQPPEPLREACSAAYPDYCIPPPPPDLNCPDINGRKPFRVLPPDPHHFDRDHDGWGCEPPKVRRRT